MKSGYHSNMFLLYLVPFCLILLQHIPRCNSVVLINEINANNPGTDTTEFIELFNQGNQQVNLSDYTIVLYNGRGNIAYAIVPLAGGIILPGGLYVMGNSNVQPDRLLTDIDGDGFNILQNGPDAIALYRGNTSMFTNGMSVTNTSLVDAIVYDSTRRGRHDAGLTNVLTPGERTIHEFGQHIEGGDESISRCTGTDPRRLSQYQLAPLTPGRVNNCSYIPPTEPPATTQPSVTGALIGEDLYPTIVINEFNVETQFIELYDGGIGEVPLLGLLLVFYSGASSRVYTTPIVLNGYVTNDDGYFLIARSGFTPAPDVVLTSSISGEGVNAIALHIEDPSILVDGSPVTSRNMLDVVVYGTSTETETNNLVNVLSIGQAPLLEDASTLPSQQADEAVSLSRCRGWRRVMPQSFRTTPATPGIDNVCALPEIVINEINAAAEGNARDEFIEIYDGGLGRQSLDGIIVVAYNGKNDAVYRSYDLTGYETNEQGFAVLGFVNNSYVTIPVETNNKGFIQAGPDAVALHLGTLPRYKRGSSPTSYNLIDAIIYGTGDRPDLTLQHALLPLQNMPNELRGISGIDHSISRCECCRRLNATTFGVGPVSPGQMNTECTRNGTTIVETLEHYQDIIRINEVHPTRQGLRQGEYLELSDGGLGNVPLDGLIVVIYNGNGNDRSTTLIYLDGYATDSRGLFVIGSSYMTPAPGYSLTARASLYPGVSGAVAIYKVLSNSVYSFLVQSVTDRSGLVDAMVFGDAELSLVESLIPDQKVITLGTITDQTSIVRCFSHDAMDQVSFVVGTSSPGSPNTCPYPTIVLSEVNVKSQGSDVGEYIEISSLGVPYFPLNDLQVVLWKGANKKSYKVIKIDGRSTDDNGYFLIGYQGLYAPRPDITPFDSPRSSIKDGPNAVTLHSSLSGRIRRNRPLDKTGLIDGVVYYITPDRYSQDLVDFFTPGVEPVMEFNTFSRRDESVNRCENEEGVNWVLAHISPKGHNLCPSRPDAVVVINEVNLVANEQFIELWDRGDGYTNLGDFVVVLYGENNQSYWAIPLTDYMTDAMGYFTMGVAGARPRVKFVFADGFMRTQYGAIAVYRSSSGNPFIEGASPLSTGLVDAVVYSQNGIHNPLSNVLTAKTAPIQSALLQTSRKSLSRCFSHDLHSNDAFAITRQTPNRLNNCPVLPTDIVINEINVQQPGDRSKEFIELYDGGVGGTPLQYITLVLFNGHNRDRSYMTFDLDQYKTNEQGYFVIGSDRVRGDVVDIVINTRNRRQAEDSSTSSGLLQDGPDAVALYRSPAGAFPYNTRATRAGLIDAIVYSTGDEDSVTLINRLMPGNNMVKEDETHLARDESISRCLGMTRLDPEMYMLAKPTPGRRNNCTGASEKFQTSVLISEINVDMPGPINNEFIELFDGGIGYTTLDGLILVFFNGANQDRSYLEIDLKDKRTNATGYFLVGTIGVQPTPDIIINDNVLQNGPDAVALYHGTIHDFLRGTIATNLNLIDVVVYGPSANQDAGLITKLAPAQVQIHESVAGEPHDWSLSRCASNQTVSMLSFKSAPPSPGGANKCSQSRSALPDLNSDTTDHSQILTQLIINEIYYTSNNPTDVAFTADYIELKGPANTPLDDYTLAIISKTGYVLYFAKLTNQQTYLDGIFAIATTNMVVPPDFPFSSAGVIPRGAGAVVLYRDSAKDYPVGSFVTVDNIVDALVFTDQASLLSNRLSNMLMKDVLSFYSGDLGSLSEPLSISRCTCCETRTSTVFTLAPPTFGLENQRCPSKSYGRKVQMRLLNGAYDIWSGNTGLLDELKGQIVTGINKYCQCGFNVNYLTDDQILNGSVIYQTNMLAYSSNQSELLYNSYVRYIHEVKEVRVHGMTYMIDDKCVDNCVGVNPALSRTGGANKKAAVYIVVCVIVIVLVTGLIVAAFLVIRQRNLLQYLKEFKDTTRTADGELKIPGRCSVSHLDIFSHLYRGTATMTGESFINPVYNEGGTSATKDAVALATVPEVQPTTPTSVKLEAGNVSCDTDQPAQIAVVEVTNETVGSDGCYSNGLDHGIDEIPKDGNLNEMNGQDLKADGVAEVDIGDKKPILVEGDKKRKKGKKDKSRNKKNLDNVLRKLRQGDASGEGEEGIDDSKGGASAGAEQEGTPSNKYVHL